MIPLHNLVWYDVVIRFNAATFRIDYDSRHYRSCIGVMMMIPLLRLEASVFFC